MKRAIVHMGLDMFFVTFEIRGEIKTGGQANYR